MSTNHENFKTGIGSPLDFQRYSLLRTPNVELVQPRKLKDICGTLQQSYIPTYPTTHHQTPTPPPTTGGV